MTILQAMYDGQANSPAAVLAETLLIGGTSCTVDDDSILPAAPMLLVIGADHDDAETVLMTAKPGSNVLTITRAQDGTTAKEWAAGTKVQRCFTSYDYNTLIDNIGALNAGKAESDHDHDGDYEPADANIQSHISNTSNPHAVTASQIGAVDKVTTGDKIQLYGVNASNVQTMYDVDAASGIPSLSPDVLIKGTQNYSKVIAASTKTLAVNDNGTTQYNSAGAILLDPAADVTLNGGTDTITIGTADIDHTYTIPKNTSVSLPVGFEMDFVCGNNHSKAFLKQVATNVWECSISEV